MRWATLSDTLLALVESLEPEPGSGLCLTGAELSLPMEVSMAVEEGRPVFFAMPPHTRWKSGVLPPVHMARLRLEGTAAAEELDAAATGV